MIVTFWHRSETYGYCLIVWEDMWQEAEMTDFEKTRGMAIAVGMDSTADMDIPTKERSRVRSDGLVFERDEKTKIRASWWNGSEMIICARNSKFYDMGCQVTDLDFCEISRALIKAHSMGHENLVALSRDFSALSLFSALRVAGRLCCAPKRKSR